VRLLLIHDQTREAFALERAIGDRAQLRSFGSLAAAADDLGSSAWRPDLLVIELPESSIDWDLLGQLKRVIGDTPVLLGLPSVLPFLDSMSTRSELKPGLHARRPGLETVVQALVEQQRALSQAILAQRTTLKAEVAQIASEAAEAAAGRAIERLTARLGFGDAEGLHLAVRFARGWEEAKLKFLSALTTGLASAFLLALGAGIVAVIKNSGSK
jgi:hypothetical protein